MAELEPEQAPENNTKQAFQPAKALRNFLDGSIIANRSVYRQWPFIVFLVIIAFYYINNGLQAQKTVRQINKLQKEVRDLKSESLAIASELMYSSNQTELAKILKEKVPDLKESMTPPQKIIMKKK